MTRQGWCNLGFAGIGGCYGAMLCHAVDAWSVIVAIAVIGVSFFMVNRADEKAAEAK